MLPKITRDERVNKAFEMLWDNLKNYGRGTVEVKTARGELYDALVNSVPEIESDIQDALGRAIYKYRMLPDDEKPEEYRYAWFVFNEFNE